MAQSFTRQQVHSIDNDSQQDNGITESDGAANRMDLSSSKLTYNSRQTQQQQQQISVALQPSLTEFRTNPYKSTKQQQQPTTPSSQQKKLLSTAPESTLDNDAIVAVNLANEGSAEPVLVTISSGLIASAMPRSNATTTSTTTTLTNMTEDSTAQPYSHQRPTTPWRLDGDMMSPVPSQRQVVTQDHYWEQAATTSQALFQAPKRLLGKRNQQDIFGGQLKPKSPVNSKVNFVLPSAASPVSNNNNNPASRDGSRLSDRAPIFRRSALKANNMPNAMNNLDFGLTKRELTQLYNIPMPSQQHQQSPRQSSILATKVSVMSSSLNFNPSSSTPSSSTSSLAMSQQHPHQHVLQRSSLGNSSNSGLMMGSFMRSNTTLTELHQHYQGASISNSSSYLPQQRNLPQQQQPQHNNGDPMIKKPLLPSIGGGAFNGTTDIRDMYLTKTKRK